MPDIHESGENYLETILVLRERGVDVRSIDIVHEMELSKPSVSRAMSILRSGGFIEVDKDGYITLTEPGVISSNSSIYFSLAKESRAVFI